MSVHSQNISNYSNKPAYKSIILRRSGNNFDFTLNLLSKWLQIALLGLPPASEKILMISNGDSGSLPGWKLTGAPVESWALALATIDFLSKSEIIVQLYVVCNSFCRKIFHKLIIKIFVHT